MSMTLYADSLKHIVRVVECCYVVFTFRYVNWCFFANILFWETLSVARLVI